MTKEIQAEYDAFLQERPIMKRGSVFATERLIHEADELYVEVVDEPTPEQLEAIGGEIADIFMFLSCVANNYGLNIEDEVRRKLEINRQRFPVEEFQTGSYHEAYGRVKQREGKVKPVDVYSASISTEDHFEA